MERKALVFSGAEGRLGTNGRTLRESSGGRMRRDRMDRPAHVVAETEQDVNRVVANKTRDMRHKGA